MSKDRFGRYVVRAQRFGARTVLFQDAAARRLDLTATELECFRLVQHEGPLTATDLARETGLTRASLSVIVDKLVSRKLLGREQDPNDRRRWILRPNPGAIAKVEAIYAAHASRVEKLLDEYTEEEFEVVLRFMEQLADELKNTAIRLTQGEAAREPGKM
ncbi:MarR family winged helix-turn-helix transcriptional regulator [Salinisphaera aquimarina]|uniref:MarR family winged helix-turn-helix transcriptional regulator n=1 Tax=Salinisphaera aquimarina TaxID=2094031 RepID=A0ABV7EN62_9GAMM